MAVGRSVSRPSTPRDLWWVRWYGCGGWFVSSCIFCLVRCAPGREGRAYPERRAVRHANGQVRKDREQPVGQRRPESQVVRDLVDGQEEILVRCRANNVSHRPELPRPEFRVAQEVGAGDLYGDDEGDDVLGQGLGAAELGDLCSAKGRVSICP